MNWSRLHPILALIFALVRADVEINFVEDVTVRVNRTIGPPLIKTYKFGGNPRIYGGKNAREGEFPFLVLMLYSPSMDFLHATGICTSVLISVSWILSAAHCVGDVPPECFKMVGGRANLWKYLWARIFLPFNDTIDEKEFKVQERTVKKIFRCPYYNWEVGSHDLSLLLTTKPFVLTPKVRLTRLARGKFSRIKHCHIAGWGLSEYQNFSYRLIKAGPVKVYPGRFCETEKDPGLVCLKGKSGTCRGDSGGPLLCNKHVWGVAAFTVGGSDCGDTTEDYFVLVEPDLHWIDTTMKENQGQSNVFKLPLIVGTFLLIRLII